jgi:hypothetical protein
MERFDYKVENKGAAMGPKTQGGEHLFTYLMADDKGKNLHCYTAENENWVSHRDNGTMSQVDQDVISKLKKAYNYNA